MGGFPDALPNSSLLHPEFKMSHAIAGLLFAWNKNLDYGPKLVADLSDDQMTAHVDTGSDLPANHPAWVFSHLNAYLPVIQAIVQGLPFDDPKEHPFGMLSKPEADSSLYAPKQQLVETFVEGHERVGQLLEQADDSILALPITLPRWQSIMPVAGVALPYLMLNHENGHLGQISAWRRIQGLPAV